MRHVVVVVGGGITGLSTAYFSQEQFRASDQPVEIFLVERDHRLGGKVLTERVQDFVIEGGPDSFLTLKPWALQLCERLGMADQLLAPQPGRKTFILFKNRLRQLPEGAMGVIPTHFAALLKSDLFSTWGKIRMGLELLVPPKRDGRDESLGEFVRRRLGPEPLERLAEPLLAGVYAANANQLSLKAAFPQLRALEHQHGSLIAGALAYRRQHAISVRKSNPLFMTLRTGLNTLIETLRAQLQKASIITGQPVTHLSRHNTQYHIRLADERVIEADALVLATPAYVTAGLLKPLNSEAAELLADIPYVSTAVVTMAFRRSDVVHPLDATGFLIPRIEGRDLTACTWSSSKWPARAPEGFVLLRCFFGRSGQEDILQLDDKALVRLACGELRDLLGLRGEPVLTRVHRWPTAMPQYLVGHLDRLSKIERILEEYPGLFLAGAAYRGIGLPDCIHEGAVATERIYQYISAIA